MNKVSLRISLSAFIIGLLFCMSCSKKTSTPTKTQEAPNTQQAERRGPQEGQGRQQGPPPFSQMLTKMDQNKDGKLASSEVQGRLKENFAKIDANADGFITEEEFKNAPRPPRGRRN